MLIVTAAVDDEDTARPQDTKRLAEKCCYVREISVVTVIEMVEDLIADDTVVEPVSSRQFDGAPLVNLHLGIIGESLTSDLHHARIELNAMQCLAAIRLWQLTKGDLPNDLDEIVRAAGMTGVPIDHFNNQPLKLTFDD